jgi:two-component system response regulator PhcR
MMTSTSTQALSILFVDDESKARKYFVKAFSDRYRVFCAESVDQAIELLEDLSGNLAVLVTDQRMPRKTGIDLVKYAKRNHPHVIRILTTAYADLMDAIDSVNEGEVYRYIRKPWDLPYLQAEVGRAVDLFLKQQEERELIIQKREVMYRVASNIAHELRTPLTGIGVSVEGISEDVQKLLTTYERAEAARLAIPPISASRRGMLSKVMDGISAQVERAHNIIDMLLVSARPRTDGSLETISMADCVSQAIDSYPVPEHQQGCFEVTVRDDFSFLGIKVLAIHILYNLIKNSLYAMNGGKREARIEIGIGNVEGRGRLSFRDNGNGISSDQLPHIFDDFFSTKIESSNNGIGLAFCRRTLEQWGATIHCSSVPGEYTEFLLGFPIAMEGEATAIRKSNSDSAA